MIEIAALNCQHRRKKPRVENDVWESAQPASNNNNIDQTLPMHSLRTRTVKRNHTVRLAPFSTLILGVIVFLETQSPIAGAVLPAVHAGWRSFRTAIWILRSGRACSDVELHCAFSLATASWQAAAAALGSVVLFVAVASFTGKKPDMAHFAATMITLTSGVALCTLLGLSAVMTAAIRKTRVWVHPRLREILSGDLNYVSRSSSERFNYAVFILATSVSAPILAGSCFLLIEAETTAYGLTLMLAGPGIALASYIWLSPRVVAAHPWECWMPEDFPATHPRLPYTAPQLSRRAPFEGQRE